MDTGIERLVSFFSFFKDRTNIFLGLLREIEVRREPNFFALKESSLPIFPFFPACFRLSGNECHTLCDNTHTHARKKQPSPAQSALRHRYRREHLLLSLDGVFLHPSSSFSIFSFLSLFYLFSFFFIYS